MADENKKTVCDYKCDFSKSDCCCKSPLGLNRSLCDLKPNECARVDCVDVSGPLGCRLRQMGLVHGAPVRFCKCAPFGDPVEIKLKHTHLMLRKSEAACVRIQPEEACK